MKNHTHIVWQEHHLNKTQRSIQKAQKPCMIWLTGLSGSGKSTIANALEQKLYVLEKHTYLLDGDNVRHGLNKDLGFSDHDRVENIRRIGEVGKLFIDAGLIVISAFISPFQSDRQIVRNLVNQDEFLEVFIDAPIELCERRDPKGLYKKARCGEIKNFTGIDSPYEAPLNPEVHIKTDVMSVDESVQCIIDALIHKGYLNG